MRWCGLHLWSLGAACSRRRRLLCLCSAALCDALLGCSALEGLFRPSARRSGPGEEVAETEWSESPDAPLVYRRIRGRHYLAKVLDEGAMLVLEDGSNWRVEPNDLIYSAGWTSHQDIIVHDMHAAPRYRMVNASKQEQVTVEYLGTPPEL